MSTPLRIAFMFIIVLRSVVSSGSWTMASMGSMLRAVGVVDVAKRQL
jgi:hypothetical protein